MASFISKSTDRSIKCGTLPDGQSSGFELYRSGQTVY